MIKVKINKLGIPEFTVNEVKGSACIDVTKPILDRLGRNTEVALTSEYYEETNGETVIQN